MMTTMPQMWWCDNNDNKVVSCFFARVSFTYGGEVFSSNNLPHNASHDTPKIKKIQRVDGKHFERKARVAGVSPSERNR